MEYRIENRPAFTTLHIELNAGEQVRAEAGAMVAMTPSVTLEAKSSGKGFLGSIKAAVGGESFFATLFTAQDKGEITLAPTLIGDIIDMHLTGNSIYAQGGSYLAGHKDLQISTSGSMKALISGEGLFLQKISGAGHLFLNSYGSIIERELKPGERYIVDTGHILAFEDTIHYQVKKAAKGIFSTLASGEGLVCEYEGPGKIWLQTRNLSPFAKLIATYLPSSR